MDFFEIPMRVNESGRLRDCNESVGNPHQVNILEHLMFSNIPQHQLQPFFLEPLMKKKLNVIVVCSRARSIFSVTTDVLCSEARTRS